MYFLFLTILAIFSNVHSAHLSKDGVDIVGGDPVDIVDFNYQVALLMEGKLWCGGSIITENYVLTAGHCVRLAMNLLTVRSGSSFWSKDGSLHDVDHNATFAELQTTDVAVLRVVQSFVFDNTRQPIKLATPQTPLPSGQMTVATGWGSTDDGSFPEQLRAVQVPLVDKKTCNKDYGGPGSRFGKIGDGQLCAGIVHKDSCQGDSGGPLVLNGVQIGITSMGHGCGELDYPGIYADVGYFNSWIQKQITV